MFMFNLILTEEEVAIVLQALGHYQYNNPYITQETFSLADNVRNKIDEIL